MTRTQWEYMQTDHKWPKIADAVSRIDHAWQTLELGANGWELVTVVRTPSGTLTAFWKREVIVPPVAAKEVIEGKKGKKGGKP